MEQRNKEFQGLGFYPADILLPKAGTDVEKWAVVACDQFTSQPEYWEAVDRFVGDAPSALRLVLPEAHLGSETVGEEISAINRTMQEYLENEAFETLEDSLIYLERIQSDGSIRRGLIGRVDLEEYDFTPGSSSLIRATEGTVLSRIPPRVKVRKDAPIELPHIMVLIDDPAGSVIEPLTQEDLPVLYDSPLMQGGGRVCGRLVPREDYSRLAAALKELASPAVQQDKYGSDGSHPLLFAMGDGNHSLATAKQCWEDAKKDLPREVWDSCPARYALVELVNLHDGALKFEPIHRVVFGVDPEKLLAAYKAAYPGCHEGAGCGHSVEYLWAGGRGVLTVPKPEKQLAVGTLQDFLDAYLKENGGEVDYIHGEEVVEQLTGQKGTVGFLLPAMAKEDLFKTVLFDGVTPRKTFSMGHAQDKRYYLEARRIK